MCIDTVGRIEFKYPGDICDWVLRYLSALWLTGGYSWASNHAETKDAIVSLRCTNIFLQKYKNLLNFHELMSLKLLRTYRNKI